MDLSLFASVLDRGSSMHIESLGDTQTPRRTTAPSQYFCLRHADVGAHEPGYGMELQMLYAAEHTAKAGQGEQQTPLPPVPASRQPESQSPGVSTQYQYQPHNQGGPFRYPDVRQNMLTIPRRFERQEALRQSACGFPWSANVKVDPPLGHYLLETAERYNIKQVNTWWNQLPTLQYLMERMPDGFKTSITPAQAMKLFTEPNDTKRSWIDHCMYIMAVSEATGG
ncbi:hypothetical protein PF008_g9971 [Phytophthora fragariae]|uniref:Uncharacterized protein n=2 Tax=Phytophthora fragariae TaxID=53985 RepID=A0A6G0RUZ2_9STRA|nr:hypothetical protein PF008_g9971 [Phytophthora fragariae]